jgi:SAM-dependent methyltransferase
MTPPTQCPICTTQNTFKPIGTHVDGTQTYTLYECPKCKAQFWEPLKNPGGEWYGHDERYSDRNKLPILKPNWNHRKIISYLAPMHGRVLDVGCGVGTFLAYAVKNGWQGAGIDFDTDAIVSAQRAFGLSNLFVMDLVQFAIKFPNERFDLVTFFDVLEHVDNHREFMAQVRGVLKEKGYIAMSMPYRGRAEWLMRGDVPPRHLTKWDRESLKNFLNQEGFDVEYMHRTPASIRFIILKLRFMYGKSLSSGLVGKARTSAQEGKKSALKNLYVKVISAAAITKDTILFGIPALGIWLSMLLSNKRYIGLYAIARKRN